MIDENELRIANTSYVNKDFATIYPELLDIVKSLTNKWNPQTSNESDPGVVLLKLLGFIGDKLNYNIDKNVLEAFMPSATQTSSMRKLLSPLGYEMGYYHAATTKVQFTYLGDALDTSGVQSAKSFTLPALSTIITNDDSSIQFILTQPATITGKNIPVEVEAIQGSISTLTSGDSDTILLESIDTNHRVYFPVTMVAENGVFICNVDTPNSYWDRTTNLNTSLAGTYVYKFGYDSSRGLPYIEFPDDIANLIGGGLNIHYVVCNGIDGNISARTLTTLVSPTSDISITGSSDTISFEDEEGNELLSIKNLSASVDGADPETIDEAYSNYKKTIGTFDTLVTCRDYANAIYNMGSEYVSNCQVSDRRTDLTYTVKELSYDEYGQKQINVANSINKDVTAYDLFLYPLSPLTSYTIEGYDNSFKPLDSTSYIKNGLEESKSISHDYYTLGDNDLFALKNYLKLRANISTTYKVNSYERKDILSNVVLALIKRFNARNVDYGYEIPYDDILDTIEQADSRISSVSLAEPSLTTNVMKANGKEVPLLSSDGLDFLLTILAHNIMQGKVALFDYDDDFQYDFGQKDLKVVHNLKTISTETKIQLASGTAFENLAANEVIQLIAPSMVTSLQYVAYTLYHFDKKPDTGSISAGTNYKLKDDEVLWIYYTDSSTKEVVVKKYEKGTIIQPVGFTLSQSPTTSGQGAVSKTFTYDGTEQTIYFKQLGASESINLRKMNQTTLDKATSLYWIRNNSSNNLFTAADKGDDDIYETILGDGEYVFYTDEGFNNLVSLGSGTTIKTNHPDATQWVAPPVEYEEIAQDGLLSLKSKWKTIYLTKSQDTSTGTYMELQENSILTLVEGDSLTWTGDDTTNQTMTLGNKLASISGSISYVSSGTSGTLEGYELDDGTKWGIKSRLDIDSGPDYAQTITDNRQTIKFTSRDGTEVTCKAGQQFNLNEAYQFIGSDSIDASSLDIVTNKTKYPFSVVVYELDKNDSGTANTLSRDSQGYATKTLDNNSPLNLIVPNTKERGILMVHANPGEGESPKITISSLVNSSSNSYIREYNTNAEWGSSLDITSAGMHCIEIQSDEISSETLSLSISTTATKDKPSTIIFDRIRFIKADKDATSTDSIPYGLNEALGLTSSLASTVSKTKDGLKVALLNKISSLDDSSNPQFYYTCRVANDSVIESDDLTSPESLYDINNIANRFTISQIDFDDISNDITIVRSSRL